jgi:phage-related protein (TIGR01555 family)
VIRAWVRRWLGIVDPPVKPDAPASLEIDASTLASFQGMPVKRREIKPPQLFPGVVPDKGSPLLLATDAMPKYMGFDSADIAPVWDWARTIQCGIGFPGYAYLSELTQRSEYRAPSETIASEMTREWITIKTKGKTGDNDTENDRASDDGMPPPASGAEDKIEDIQDRFEQLNIRDAFRRLAEQDGLFGCSHLYIDINHGNRDEKDVRQLPLVIGPDTIKKGSLKGFTVIEPIWATPFYYNAIDPTQPNFYKPRAWFVLGQKIHADRLLTFVSREVPDLLKPAYNFGGISLTQLMEPYVFQWLRTRNSVSDLVHNFSIIVLKTEMSAVLQGTTGASSKGGMGLLDRIKLFVASRDNQGVMALDKGTEELQQIAVPLSGLDALQAQAQEHMAAPSHIPLVKLLGITPTGLNASSEGEIKVFYDWIRSQQQAFFSKHLQTVLEIVQLDLFGKIDDAITFEYVPLSSPTVKELADIRKADSDGGVALINAGVISSDEERERLQADPNSGYTNLSGPAPEPPAPEIDPETGLSTGNTLPPAFGKKPDDEADTAE